MTTSRKLTLALVGAALFTGAGFSWHARAESESSEQIPRVFQGKQFTVVFSNGDKQEFAQYVRTINVNGQLWMLLQNPNGNGGSGQLLVNPAQVRAIEGVP